MEVTFDQLRPTGTGQQDQAQSQDEEGVDAGGDSTAVAVSITLLFVAGFGAAVLVVRRRRSKQSSGGGSMFRRRERTASNDDPLPPAKLAMLAFVTQDPEQPSEAITPHHPELGRRRSSLSMIPAATTTAAVEPVI